MKKDQNITSRFPSQKKETMAKNHENASEGKPLGPKANEKTKFRYKKRRFWVW